MEVGKYPEKRLNLWVSDFAKTVSILAVMSMGIWILATNVAPWPIGLSLVLVSLALSFARVNQRANLQASIFSLCEDFGFRPKTDQTGLSQIRSQSLAVRHRLLNVNTITGLPTREYLIEQIDPQITGQAAIGLLGAVRWSDFDRLASFDVSAANEALSVFALRLRRALRREHVLGQIDRDCFAIWMCDGQELDALRAEFRGICFVACQEMSGDQGILTPIVETASASSPCEGADAAQLLLRVTAGLARQDAPGSHFSVKPQSFQKTHDDFKLEQDLAQAIAENQLTMAFQPVVDLSRNRVLGAEALLRWDHPTLGSVSPAKFIPLVERTGLSERYGLWVLNAACREARTWKTQGLVGLRVAVNISAHQLLEPTLREKIARTLDRHGLPAKALELELTETAAMADAERTLQLFQELRAMGVSLAIDDFGSGYSSLSYLKNLPFDKLKIDREFVTSVDSRRDSRAICRSLIELGKGLDLTVLAEGVETAAEIATLRDLGCNVFQGYHISKPLPAEDFRAFVKKFSERAVLPVARPSVRQTRLSA